MRVRIKPRWCIGIDIGIGIGIGKSLIFKLSR